MDNIHSTNLETTRHQGANLNAIEGAMAKQVNNSSGVLETVWQDVLTLTDRDGFFYFMNLPSSLSNKHC